MSYPKISIITPTYNSAKHLKTCILSVAQQTYANKEHLIIDNLSTDGSHDILRRYSDRYPHIRVIKEKDNGIYDAMNKGIDLSASEWLYFLGSDDIMVNNNVLSDILTSPEADCSDVIYGNVQLGKNGRIYDGEFSNFKLIEKNICHQAIFYRKKVFEELGKFNTKYLALADWAFNMNWFGNSNIRRTYKDKVIAVWTQNGYSSTNPDNLFLEDKEALIRKYFPEPFVLMLYSHVSSVLTEQEIEIKQLQKQLAERESELHSLYQTFAGQLIRLYKNIRKKYAPTT